MRNPAALFFTAILPVIFLCLFVSIFGNERDESEYGNVRVATLQVPAFIALAVVSASFVGLAIGLVERARGRRPEAHPRRRRRRRGSSSPAAIGTAIVIGDDRHGDPHRDRRVAFGVRVPTATLPGLVASLVVGAFAFCALGIAYTRAISSEDAAPAMTNAVVLPLYFISGVFVPVSQLPDGLRQVADVLPVKPFVDALTVAFDPRTTGAGFAGGDLAILAAWGLVGLLVAVRCFAWTPRHQAGLGRRRGRRAGRLVGPVAVLVEVVARRGLVVALVVAARRRRGRGR